MNWIAITADMLKAAGHGLVVDKAQTTATGGIDPVADAIESATARVRRAVSAANPIDIDAAKVPLSLKGVTVRLAVYALMERIRMPLTDDQKESRKMDAGDLNRLADRKILVEAPDDPDTAAGPQNRGTWNSERKIIGRTHPVPPPARQFAAEPNGYANPDAPEDSAE